MLPLAKCSWCEVAYFNQLQLSLLRSDNRNKVILSAELVIPQKAVHVLSWNFEKSWQSRYMESKTNMAVIQFNE